MQIISSLLPYKPEQSAIFDIASNCNNEQFAPVKTVCDMESDGGGWIVIQRRVPGGIVDFYRNWADYEQGFGDLETEFWYGLRNIHCLTTREDFELRIDLQDESGFKQTWTYDKFIVDGPEEKYHLTIGPGIGPEGGFDGMAYHNNRLFSTKDGDYDEATNGECTQWYRGGWWYGACFVSGANLNGPHQPIIPPPPTPTANQIEWFNGGDYVYQPFVEMKIRPASCQLITC